MKVRVNREHHKNSRGYSSNKYCPLALALRELLPEDTEISCGSTYVRINNEVFPFSGWTEKEHNKGLDDERISIWLKEQFDLNDFLEVEIPNLKK